MMTMREVFDRVKTHLLSQRKQAERGLICAYRGSDGTKCAVGCLIKDEFYSEIFEGLGIHAPIVDISSGTWRAKPTYTTGNGDWTRHEALASALNNSGVPASASIKDMLSRLQSIHDNEGPEDWEDQLAHVERFYFPQEVAQ